MQHLVVHTYPRLCGLGESEQRQDHRDNACERDEPLVLISISVKGSCTRGGEGGAHESDSNGEVVFGDAEFGGFHDYFELSTAFNFAWGGGRRGVSHSG